MVMPARLVVDGLMLCKGWDGDDHVRDYETEFYSKVNGRKSSLCKDCISKKEKEKRRQSKLTKKKACAKNKVVMPTGFDASVMMRSFVKKCN